MRLPYIRWMFWLGHWFVWIGPGFILWQYGTYCDDEGPMHVVKLPWLEGV